MSEAPKPKKVLMESIAEHTYDGVSRPPGTRYDVEDQYVETLELVFKWAKRVPKPPRVTEPEPAPDNHRSSKSKA